MTLLTHLNGAWRARRVLLIGGTDLQTRFTDALLTELGAKTARLPPSAARDTLFRALSTSRVSAVIVPCAHALSSSCDPFAHLRALDTLLTEIREAGIPLTLLCSHEYVYRPQLRAWSAREEDATGGVTREGMIQALLQLYADGVSRGLSGDAVRVMILRHPPAVTCPAPQTAQYAAWCRSLLDGQIVTVRHPSAAGVFLHPLDVSLGTLCLGAHFFAGAGTSACAYNLGADACAVCANRSAALRLIRDAGGTRPIRESQPLRPPSPPLPDGTALRRLCGVRTILPASEALMHLLALERAARLGEPALSAQIAQQTQAYLENI